MKTLKTKTVLTALIVSAAACGNDQSSDPSRLTPPRVTVTTFGTTADGRMVDAYTLRNGAGSEMTVLTYGGILQSLKVPDRSGTFDNVVVGFDTIADYEAGPHPLHGGVTDWNTAVWEADPFQDAVGAGVLLTHVTRAEAEGAPATATAHVRYTLTPTNEVIVQYHATATAPTTIHFTQHSAFNLGGAQTPDVLGHAMTTHTRTGEGLALGASVHEPITGRTLDIRTTAPGRQFHTATPSGFCVETLPAPDAPAQPAFPTVTLQAKGEHASQIVFAFGVR
ncbi:MAG: hypothetical protein O2917_07205 [Acidobacteria bacterium]|nr:hypothetical protein [Acidobacteriota bacterium]